MAYSEGRTFEWDEAKSRRSLRERGFDFEFAVRIFEGDLLEHEDRRRDYGERRLGKHRGNPRRVPSSTLGAAPSVESSQRAAPTRGERDAYRQAFGQGNP